MDFNKISVNTQSSIKVTGNRTLYFDPYLVEEETHDADVVFITHDHFDHFDPDSLSKVCNEKTWLVLPETMASAASEKWPGMTERFIPVMPEGMYTVVFDDETDLTFETVAAYNLEKEFHPKENQWVGYVVNFENDRIYVSGDTDVTPEMKRVQADLWMLPVGGHYTLNTDDAEAVLNEMKPAQFIPTHYGTVIGKKEDGADLLKKLDPSIQGALKL